MRKAIKALALVGAFITTGLAGAGQAQAGVTDWNPTYYVGAGVGVFGIETNAYFKRTTFGAFAKAGVDANEYLGAELRIGGTGWASKTFPTTTSKVKSDWFVSYLAKGRYAFTDNLAGHVLLGATTARMNAKNNLGFNDRFSKTGFSYGIGLDYVAGNGLSVGVEWMQYWSGVNLDPVNYGTGSKGRLWGGVATLDYAF